MREAVKESSFLSGRVTKRMGGGPKRVQCHQGKRNWPLSQGGGG